MRGASKPTMARNRTKMDDAKRTGSRQHREITLLRICLLCTTNWFTVSSIYDDVKNDGCPYNGNEELTRGSWNDCCSSILTLLSANTGNFYIGECGNILASRIYETRSRSVWKLK